MKFCAQSFQHLVVLISVFFVNISEGFIDGLYCGTDNCYDILDVTRESTKGEITKAYRKLARKWHPDMHKSKADKESAQDKFTTIANAYEILRDEEQRNDYDYMLDNPEEYYQHYYNYYRRRVAPKVDVRLVVAITISIISIFQYLSGWQNYNNAINYLVQVPKYRLQAQDIARKQGLLGDKRKKDRSKTKEEIKEEEEAIIRTVVADKMDIRGGYRKPTIYDVLWLQLVFFPVWTGRYIYWYGHWIWCFTIMRNEYGEEQKLHVIRKNMGLSQGQFDSLEDHETEDFLDKELWKKDNFKDWKVIRDEEAKAKMAENSRYKQYRRYMKKGGPGQMSFGPE